MFSRHFRALSRALRTHYPAFLFGGPLPSDGAPPFVYHDVDENDFAADLEHLQRNGYRTSTTDDFVRSRAGTAHDRRSVLLTFDDGRRNFLETVYPLLEKWDARATLFVPTAWVGRTAEVGGRKYDFLSWNELSELAASDHVDVQSHGHRHALVPVSPEPTAFAGPDELSRFDVFEWSVVWGEELAPMPPRPGRPVLPSEPLLSSRNYTAVPPKALDACEAALAGGGGGATHDEGSDVSGRLDGVFRSTVGTSPRRLSTDVLVEEEFTEPLRLFQEHLGYAPRHFAFPWYLGTDYAMESAAKAGLTSVFGVGIDFRRARRMQGSLRAFGRIRGDFLRCLPGDGRRNAAIDLVRRLARLANPQHLSH